MNIKKKFFKEELKYDYEKYCYFYDEIQNKIENINKDLKDIDKGNYSVYLDAPHSTTNLEYQEKAYLREEKGRQLSKRAVFSQWKSNIFQRKISFENETIYLVGLNLKSSLPIVNPSGVTVLSRHDSRYIRISQIDINEEFNRKLGKVKLVGYYKSNGERDILHTYYHHYEKGKKSFGSAKEELTRRDENNKKNDKIDIDNFFRLTFKLAEQGLQSRALYHEKSSIIDGSAGTGKSTTAIQKLEYYHKNLKIPQEKLLIILKNVKIKKDFKSLLQDENLELNKIQIKTPNELIPNIKTYNLNACIEAEQQSKEIKKIIENFILNYDEIAINYHYKYLYVFIGEDKFDSVLERGKKVSLETIKKLQLRYENTIYKDYLIAFESIQRYKNYYDNVYRREEKIIKLNTRLLKLEQKQELNSFNEKDYQLYDRLEKELFELKSTKINEFTLDIREKKHLKNVLSKVYFNQKYISKIYLQGEKLDKKILLLKYLNFEERRYDTIVVDEAQDYSNLAELELIRLEANRIIYTGDILQNIGKNGIKKWERIHNINKILDIEKDKFELKHNFRQTYQLANASYNYRQLLLGGELEDIGTDYYDDEKELNGKSYELVKIIFNQDTKQYIKNRIEYIRNRFTSQIPIVIIYKTEEEKDQYQEELSSFRLSYDTEQTKDIDVVLVDILEAKGKQFPVVVSDIDELTDREIYLILTRGQFEVEFLSSQKDIENDFLEILYINEWIEIEEINFVKNKLNTKKDLNRNLFCEQCNKGFKTFHSLDQHMASKKHKDDWKEYFSKDEVKERLKEKNLIHNHEKGQLVKEKNNEDKKSKINYDLDEKEEKIVEDIVIQDEIEPLNLQNKKDESQKENTPKLKEQIPKHKAKITQYDENLDIDIITDEEQYQKEFIQKVQEDIKEFEEAKQNEILQEIVVVRKKFNNKKFQEQRQKIKDYLYDTYKGYCQICGFTFRKVEDGKNSFEMFNWNDKRVVKKKKSFITTADSLCLCRNCSANIKWGAFEPIFIDKINTIENFANKSLDEIKEITCVGLEDNVVKKFKDHYEWEDIYVLEIIINDEPKSIYMTNGHLIQFIAYLQLDER